MAINNQWQGTFNLCSPNPVRNSELTKTLAKCLHVPRLFPVPAFAVKMALGEMGMVILKGQRVSCQKLLEHGFEFGYNSFRQTVEHFIHHKICGYAVRNKEFEMLHYLVQFRGRNALFGWVLRDLIFYNS